MTTPNPEREEFEKWKADRAEIERTKGAYCLTPEGRAELLRIFEDDEDGWVIHLYRRIVGLEARAQASAEDARDAARWRWFRAEWTSDSAYTGTEPIRHVQTADEMDAETDAAIARAAMRESARKDGECAS